MWLLVSRGPYLVKRRDDLRPLELARELRVLHALLVHFEKDAVPSALYQRIEETLSTG